jgi:acetyl-CoA carboxylase biotin carboxyl carrier protein
MKQITAMMAGTVIEVLVKPGDQVAEGQDVLILESMKMQLPVQSELSGKVSQVKVNSGDFVNEGDTVVLLD